MVRGHIPPPKVIEKVAAKYSKDDQALKSELIRFGESYVQGMERAFEGKGPLMYADPYAALDTAMYGFSQGWQGHAAMHT